MTKVNSEEKPLSMERRINAIDQLGNYFRNRQENDLEEKMKLAFIFNKWFTTENSGFAIDAWGNLLHGDKLADWVSHYTFGDSVKSVGIVMAGNLPLVGLHDLLCVLLSGHRAVVKLSGSDRVLMQHVIDKLIEFEPDFKNHISVVDQLKGFDAVIATGSDNTGRYFEYYFRDVPSIIRKNRNSIAVLTGRETREELALLGKDIFSYFGMGCRNVTKLFVPSGFIFDTFFESIEVFSDVLNHNKYANNYFYHKSIYLMNSTPHLDNGFILVKEDSGFASPVGALFYERYTDRNEVIQRLKRAGDSIQCVVSGESDIPGAVYFGKSQTPGLQDYADGVDTMRFLSSLG